MSHSIAPSDEFEKQELSLRTSTRNFQEIVETYHRDEDQHARTTIAKDYSQAAQASQVQIIMRCLLDLQG
jgi:hypothetical protein